MPIESKLNDDTKEKPYLGLNLGLILYIDSSIISEFLNSFDDFKHYNTNKRTEKIIVTSRMSSTLKTL